MTILLDFNSIAVANIMKMATDERDENGKVLPFVFNVNTISLFRHSLLTSFLGYIRKFKRDYGKLVLCCDSKEYWRRDIFPHYKHSRKKVREKSLVDWVKMHEVLDEIKKELKTFFPYKVVETHNAEADDVIATLVDFLNREPVVIVSKDEDFLQLQTGDRIKQYCPLKKVWMGPYSEDMLIEKIVRGDPGDGIPNILSQDDIFLIDGKKQKSIMTKNLPELMALVKEENKGDCNPIDDYIKRNKTLIDFRFIPHQIRHDIVYEYQQAKMATKSEFMMYLASNRLNKLMEALGEF